MCAELEQGEVGGRGNCKDGGVVNGLAIADAT